MNSVEVHRVENGWLVHPTRGFLAQQPDYATYNDNVWVFNTDEGLFMFLERMGEKAEKKGVKADA